MDKHYHYFVSYNLIENSGSFGFGHIDVQTKNKISNKLLPFLYNRILRNSRENNRRISKIIILSINPLECACDE